MIQIGIHTDNWRPLSQSFETACTKIAALGVRHVEFAVIHGQNFIQALGYDPAVSLQANPRALRKYLEKLGLEVTQIDGSYPMMGPNGSAFGVQYVQQTIRFAAELGCPMVDTVDGAFETPGTVVRGSLPHHLRQLPAVPLLGRGLQRDHQRRDPRAVYEQSRIHDAAVQALQLAFPPLQL